MLRFLRSAAKPAVHRLPPRLRVYAIGDVHGRDDCLAALERRIADDLAARPVDGEALVILLGDYVDRGPASRAVIDRLIDRRLAGVAARCLLGNHEEGLLAFLADPVRAAGWLDWGGRETLTSYGVTPNGEPRALATALAEAMPLAHLAWLRDLELWVELGDYLFVHAGIRPGTPLDRQRRGDVLTIRGPFLEAADLGPHRVVHGHTIAADVEVLAHRIGVDTGAYASGRLSCVVIERDTAVVLAD